jgi:hypothetical protein
MQSDAPQKSSLKTLVGMIRQLTDIEAVKTEAARDTAAERMRRCRARRRAGYRCFTIELHDSEIDALVRRGLLGADDREDEGDVVELQRKLKVR